MLETNFRFFEFYLQSRRLAFDQTPSMRIASSGTPRRCLVAYFYIHTRWCWAKEPAKVVCPVPDRHCEPIGQRKEKDWSLCRSRRGLDSILCSSCEGRKGRPRSLDWIGIPRSRGGGRFPNGLGKVRVGHQERAAKLMPLVLEGKFKGIGESQQTFCRIGSNGIEPCHESCKIHVSSIWAQTGKAKQLSKGFQKIHNRCLLHC